jgi:1,2-diacylglycerol-3-alpha-glucose alpha-1,2-galactosyltransferase
MSKLKVCVVSESEMTVQGHGVHTAYVETVNALKAHDDVEVFTNSFASADIRHIHTVGPYSLLQLLLMRGKKVVSAHVVPDSFVGSLAGTKYWLWLAKIYLRWFYNRAAAVIAVSDQTKEDLKKLGVTTRIEVIYNMIDISKYSAITQSKEEMKQQLGFDLSQPVVVGNGQIQPRKRFDTFVNIARAMPDVRFVWVGGMPFGKVAASQGDMQKLIDEAPENLTVTGVVPLEKVAEYFHASDVFVMTSEQETFGLAIIEAAASGLPIVLRDIPDYDTTFRGDAVIADEDGFVDAIRRLLDDDGYYQEMKQHADSIAERYSSEAVVERLVDLYKSVLQ